MLFIIKQLVFLLIFIYLLLLNQLLNTIGSKNYFKKIVIIIDIIIVKLFATIYEHIMFLIIILNNRIKLCYYIDYY